jgi:hypothetical protein
MGHAPLVEADGRAIDLLRAVAVGEVRSGLLPGPGGEFGAPLLGRLAARATRRAGVRMITTATAPRMSPNRRSDLPGRCDRTAFDLRSPELGEGSVFVTGTALYRMVERQRRFRRRQTCTTR